MNNSPRIAFCIAYVTSAIGGYPVGAIAVVNLYKQQLITKKQACWLLPFLHSPNPFFVINYVGGDLLQNISFSVYYLIIHHCICIIATIIISKNANPRQLSVNNAFSLTTILKQTIDTMLVIATTIIFFSSLSYILIELLLTTTPLAVSIVTIGALELTNGLQFAASKLSNETLLLYITFLLTSQSFSIHLQVASIIYGTLSLKPYLLIRGLLTVIAMCCIAIFIYFS